MKMNLEDPVILYVYEQIKFDPTHEASRETIEKIKAICENASKQEKKLISKVINDRLTWIVDHTEAPHKTDGTDNDLLEICWRWLRDQMVSEIATQITVYQLESTIATIIRSYGMIYDQQTRVEYISTIYEVCTQYMPLYEASKGKPVTYLTPHIRGALFKLLAKDKDITKHYALRLRDIENAKKGILEELGISNPSHVEIVDYINKRPDEFTPITIKIIENIEKNKFVVVDAEENTASTIDGPEVSFFKKQITEQLLHMFDDQSGVLQKIWKIHLHYFASNLSTEHMPSLQYLKEMYNRGSDQISDDRLRMETARLQMIVRDKIRGNGDEYKSSGKGLRTKSSSINYFNAGMEVIEEMDKDIYDSIMAEMEEI